LDPSNDENYANIETIIMYWNLDKAALIASAKCNDIVARITVNPWNNAAMITSGKRCLKMWKLTESGALMGTNIVNKRDLQTYTDHIWLTENTFVVSNEIGDILLFQEHELLCTLQSIFPQRNAVSCIKPTSWVSNSCEIVLCMTIKSWQNKVTNDLP
jgi:hypothetical protein